MALLSGEKVRIAFLCQHNLGQHRREENLAIPDPEIPKSYWFIYRIRPLRKGNLCRMVSVRDLLTAELCSISVCCNYALKQISHHLSSLPWGSQPPWDKQMLACGQQCQHDWEIHKYENGWLPPATPKKFISKAELNTVSDKFCPIIYKTLEVQLLTYTYLIQYWKKIPIKN